jgi:hypothetical protein
MERTFLTSDALYQDSGRRIDQNAQRLLLSSFLEIVSGRLAN